jgi:hypothetical protein
MHQAKMHDKYDLIYGFICAAYKYRRQGQAFNIAAALIF